MHPLELWCTMHLEFLSVSRFLPCFFSKFLSNCHHLCDLPPEVHWRIGHRHQQPNLITLHQPTHHVDVVIPRTNHHEPSHNPTFLPLMKSMKTTTIPPTSVQGSAPPSTYCSICILISTALCHSHSIAPSIHISFVNASSLLSLRCTL